MRIERWWKVVAIWGLIVLVYCVVVWPRQFEPSPFLRDEAHIAARVDIMVQFVAFWLVPVVLVWAIGRRDRAA
jgi:hypothetical protein